MLRNSVPSVCIQNNSKNTRLFPINFISPKGYLPWVNFGEHSLVSKNWSDVPTSITMIFGGKLQGISHAEIFFDYFFLVKECYEPLVTVGWTTHGHFFPLRKSIVWTIRSSFLVWKNVSHSYRWWGRRGPEEYHLFIAEIDNKS